MENVDSHSNRSLPNAYYFVVARLLVVSSCAIAFSIAEFLVGNPIPGFYAVFALFCLYRACQFLWHARQSWDQVASLYHFLLGANWCILPWVLAGLAFVWWSPSYSIASFHPLFLIACTSVPLDILFCMWAIKKLEDQEFLLQWDSLQYNSGFRRFSIPTVLLWTTALAVAFATYGNEMRSVGYKQVSYFRQWCPPYEMTATEIAKPLFPGSDSTPILFISVIEGKNG
ncbi:MAG: hypothetical protein AAF483_25715, partial [Planctomycetota bacterium]